MVPISSSAAPCLYLLHIQTGRIIGPMSNDWREKYFQVLDQQEQQEVTYKQQLEFIRQALVRVSLAADGLDSELDSKLKGLRYILRPQENKTPTLGEGQVKELEEAVLTFERERKQRGKQAQASFELLSEQLRGLDLPKDINGGLKRYKKGVKQRLENLQEYPLLLKEISSLQRQALDALGDKEGGKPGFFRRFLGDRSASKGEGQAETIERGAGEEGGSGFEQELDQEGGDLVDSDINKSDSEGVNSGAIGPDSSDLASGADSNTDTTLDTSTSTSTSTNTDTDTDSFSETTKFTKTSDDAYSGETIEGELSDDEPQAEAVFQRPLHEPAFSKISAKVTCVLTELLEQVEASPCVVQKVENAKKRIDRGLNWFELVPTLEDIRDLVMQAYLEADREHMAYLAAVNDELGSIYELLGGAAEAEKLNREAGEVFKDSVGTTVDSLLVTISGTNDIQQMKSSLNEQLSSIKGAISEFQSNQNSGPEPLAVQLQTLAQRVQTMESDAKKSQENFEEQRRKALEDALTGLPNRQAYNERIHHEQGRWQRYKHPLTLAICDIDFFKRVNDNYGHQAGDRVLRVIGQAISKRLREVDFMARYGGEEFVLIMPETPADAALGILDKIRVVLAETPFHFKEQPVQITLSIGISAFGGGDTAESVFERADKALYQAKEGGRNQCCVNIPHDR